MTRSLTDVRAANLRAASALTSASPSIIPLAILLGGTSGIGLATAYALSTAFRGKIHLLLSSRSAARGKEAIEGLPFPPSVENGGSAEFVEVDASSMKSVVGLGRVLRGKVEERSGGKVNYLVLSCGQLVFQGSDRTEEGIERKLAMNYYARFALAEMLSPNLEKASQANEPARVISILAPGRGGPIDTSDFGLAKEAEISGKSMIRLPTWLRQAEMAGVTYGDWATEYLAERHGRVSYIHTYPGIVKTPVMGSMPFLIRLLSAPIFALAGISSEESGENHANYLLDDEGAIKGGGAFFRGPKGQEVQRTQIKGLEGEERKQKIAELWQHTVEVTGIDA
ncbi:unnamed protein product [Tilletia controversa]|uniref:Ketoreductase (KR) domain-containing protein n=2 Tax=Tilletia TaxID=13289 RepID=A0A177T0Y5_9BASI|nr:hypothetical protein CF335_g8778 [Tilletia laevis]KAE8196001.1 hypothetical protein CF328_g4269 [Tilletia controversa]KAE8259700.1 hypothetical protein A4X03_0g4020 [Tilletia caries]KAE8191924.1 hypothetical protein CF336_g4645 [Tilletia laevis]CAD6884661.1 unnamed protein product [Tilletia caries]